MHFQSVYADIALTLGRYLLDQYQPEMSERQIDVSDMVVEKALIARPAGPQPLRTRAEVDWDTKSAKCKFYSVDVRDSIL